MTNDNPRNLEPPLLELRRLLREVFNRPIDEWVIRWENRSDAGAIADHRVPSRPDGSCGRCGEPAT